MAANPRALPARAHNFEIKFNEASSECISKINATVSVAICDCSSPYFTAAAVSALFGLCGNREREREIWMLLLSFYLKRNPLMVNDAAEDKARGIINNVPARRIFLRNYLSGASAFRSLLYRLSMSLLASRSLFEGFLI
jgi:hypothetical protein